MPGVLGKIKICYLVWHNVHIILPQAHRYTLGNRVDNLFVEIIELVATATFVKPEDKSPYLSKSIQKLDALKVILMVLWETHLITDKRYIDISDRLNEIGRMLGGWYYQPTKKNSPAKAGEK